MFRKILIANRGEIAVRIIRACKEMNIRTVAVYSEADRNAMHTILADEAVCIGPAPSAKSYLNMKNILEAACLKGAEAIHPGFGFLSENAQFAKICEESGITFIGPKPEIIDLMGNKSNAKAFMKKAGVPVIPGSEGNLSNVQEAQELARKIGYPIMLKAAAGGGGKGIRLVEHEKELARSFEIVKQEAKNSFQEDAIYMEKFIAKPRHVEIQILADNNGNCVHLGERDCSLQRHNQKVLEESPSTVLDEELRQKMGAAALKAVKASGYTNAGTIEFLVDKQKQFYFMEMNTRLQVEHPVTEWVTDVDIVKEQIRIAAGETMTLKQEQMQFRGHSIECRINAENPKLNFRPSPGEIRELNLPGGNGIRIDTAVYEGYVIPPMYDSMIAKLIVHGKNREEAIQKMKSALREVVMKGIDTNIPFLQEILNHPKFVSGEFDTNFIKEELEEKGQ